MASHPVGSPIGLPEYMFGQSGPTLTHHHNIANQGMVCSLTPQSLLNPSDNSGRVPLQDNRAGPQYCPRMSKACPGGVQLCSRHRCIEQLTATCGHYPGVWASYDKACTAPRAAIQNRPIEVDLEEAQGWGLPGEIHQLGSCRGSGGTPGVPSCQRSICRKGGSDLQGLCSSKLCHKPR